MSYKRPLDTLEAIPLADQAAAVIAPDVQERTGEDAIARIIGAWECHRMEIDFGLARCESPIERALYLQLFFRVAKLRLDVRPQHTWENYRADFAFIDNWDEGRVLAIVECDGHDFHEKTKEQAARDKKRFTGSEVFRNAAACADEVVTAMKGLGLEGKRPWPQQ
jgi:very-short-patch-repair endonuclease